MDPMPLTHARLAALEAAGEAFVVLTLAHVAGSAPREPGARMLLRADGSIESTIGGGGLEHDALADARRLLAARLADPAAATCELRTYFLNASRDQCCGGEVQVLFTVHAPRLHVVLVGAGHVAQAVATVLAPLDLDVSVLDDRPEWNTAERFPRARRLLEAPEDTLLDFPPVPAHSLVYLMSHSHRRDFECLRMLVPRGLRVLGLIGSRAKWARFRTSLLAQGFAPDDVARVHSPIGIGVGGKHPSEIAISVAAEVLAVRDGRAVTVTRGAPAAGLPDAADIAAVCGDVPDA